MSALPPGPRLPARPAGLGLDAAAAALPRALPASATATPSRCGSSRWGDWVVLCDPADVKKVFTAGDAVGVAIANPLLGPVLGSRSVMLLEEPRAHDAGAS